MLLSVSQYEAKLRMVAGMYSAKNAGIRLKHSSLVLQVAKALVEFETLWHQAWLKGIDQQRAGLQVPLIVRHPDTGQLLVNLDKELMQLIR